MDYSSVIALFFSILFCRARLKAERQLQSLLKEKEKTEEELKRSMESQKKLEETFLRSVETQRRVSLNLGT